MNFFFGFSYWKHDFIKPFFPLGETQKHIFINPFFKNRYLKKALVKGLDKDSRIYIWGRKGFPEVQSYAEEHDIPLFRVEDGFIRSIGLGSDLTQPYSQVIDSRGIYFDPTQESELEHILQTYDFQKAPRLLERAAKVRRELIRMRLSKYNLYDDVELSLPEGKRIILVPGQVEDDASIRYGAPGMTNLGLLKQVYENAPDAYIIFKPHPDVLVGNRIGVVEEVAALRYCDKIVTTVSIHSVLSYADEVHTMTSLVGLEALMQEKRVVTYGLPFYAGWGLTVDKRSCKRRTRTLSIDELLAGTLLLYPRYIDPETKELCEIEVVITTMQEERQRSSRSLLHRTKKRSRAHLSRMAQRLLRRAR